MSVLLQISDTHFGTEQSAVVEALVDFTRRLAPDVILLSGDITQRARRGQFAAARAFVDALGAPRTLVIPGNHDIPLFNIAARLFHPYRNFIRAFGADFEPQYSSASLLLICVNTTRPWRHKDGEVSAEQIARVSERLRAAGHQQVRIVVTHQPVHVIREHDIQNLLHGHSAAVRAWSHAGADLILGGHIHLPYVRSLTEPHHLERPVWAVQAGTAVSHRTREGVPNSVNVVRCTVGGQEPAVEVERWDYDASDRRFVKVFIESLAPVRGKCA